MAVTVPVLAQLVSS